MEMTPSVLGIATWRFTMRLSKNAAALRVLEFQLYRLLLSQPRDLFMPELLPVSGTEELRDWRTRVAPFSGQGSMREHLNARLFLTSAQTTPSRPQLG